MRLQTMNVTRHSLSNGAGDATRLSVRSRRRLLFEIGIALKEIAMVKLREGPRWDAGRGVRSLFFIVYSSQRRGNFRTSMVQQLSATYLVVPSISSSRQ